MTGRPTRYVDHAALRVNQAFIIGLLVLAFVLNLWPLVAFVAAVMIIGTIWPSAGLFKLIYQHILNPIGLIKPDILEDDLAPHRFAQGMGGAFTLGAALALAAGLRLPGWGLAGLVAALAALNLFAGFCAGCFIYYRLARLGIPGFKAASARGPNR